MTESNITEARPPSVPLGSMWRRIKEHPLARVGPGLITGVADDDPSGIATYSQTGAQYGLERLRQSQAAGPPTAVMHAEFLKAERRSRSADALLQLRRSFRSAQP